LRKSYVHPSICTQSANWIPKQAINVLNKLVNKKLKYISVVAICIILSQSGCVKDGESINRLEWSCMSTTAAVQSANLESAAQLRMIATQQFEEVEQEFSAWRATSTLTMINQRAGTNKKTPVSCAFTNLLQLSVVMHHNSGGAFNPLLAPVLHMWGFGNLKTTLPEPPRTNELRAALRLAKLSDIKIESDGTVCTARLLRKGMQLDFGAIAKGYAVDLAWRQAVKQGISNVLIDLGGNLRVLGEARPGRGGWLTGIKDPFNARHLIARIMLYDGEAVATSGNYERFIEIEGKRYAHIIDGRSAWPANGTASVTVIASDAVTADALSTTLFILGADDGQRMIAENYPDVLALWIPVKQPVEIIATDNMRKRLQP
jgi:FAD:protein FMN transferase